MRVLALVDCQECGVVEALVHDPALLALGVVHPALLASPAYASGVVATLAVPGEPDGGACECSATAELCPHRPLVAGAALLEAEQWST